MKKTVWFWFFFLVTSFISVISVFNLSFSHKTSAIEPGDLFFSEYIEGSSNNKALEIYNPTAQKVDLSADEYEIEIYFNGKTSPETTIFLSGTIPAGDVFVMADKDAAASILNVADSTSSASFFNGDDAVVLKKKDVTIDVIGQIGADPGTQWGIGDTSTADNTLVRKCSIFQGDPNGADSFDPALEWDGYSNDTFTYLGSHTICPPTATPTSTSTPSPTFSPTPTSTPTTTPTSTPIPTSTPVPDLTPTLGPTPTPTPPSTLGTIVGKKYFDINKSHYRNFWEPPLNGWIVKLYNSNWEAISQKISGHTGKLGQYRFTDLTEGVYFLCEVLKPGWRQTEPDFSGGVANQSGATNEADYCKRIEINSPNPKISGNNFGNTFNWLK